MALANSAAAKREGVSGQWESLVSGGTGVGTLVLVWTLVGTARSGDLGGERSGDLGGGHRSGGPWWVGGGLGGGSLGGSLGGGLSGGLGGGLGGGSLLGRGGRRGAGSQKGREESVVSASHCDAVWDISAAEDVGTGCENSPLRERAAVAADGDGDGAAGNIVTGDKAGNTVAMKGRN